MCILKNLFWNLIYTINVLPMIFVFRTKVDVNGKDTKYCLCRCPHNALLANSLQLLSQLFALFTNIPCLIFRAWAGIVISTFSLWNPSVGLGTYDRFDVPSESHPPYLKMLVLLSLHMPFGWGIILLVCEWSPFIYKETLGDGSCHVAANWLFLNVAVVNTFKALTKQYAFATDLFIFLELMPGDGMDIFD